MPDGARFMVEIRDPPGQQPMLLLSYYRPKRGTWTKRMPWRGEGAEDLLEFVEIVTGIILENARLSEARALTCLREAAHYYCRPQYYKLLLEENRKRKAAVSTETRGRQLWIAQQHRRMAERERALFTPHDPALREPESEDDPTRGEVETAMAKADRLLEREGGRGVYGHVRDVT